MSEQNNLIFEEADLASLLTEPHTIKFADGTEITVTINGNNYISAVPIPDALLSDANLIGLTIDGEPQPEKLKCCNHFTDEEGDHIIFRQYTTAELKHQQTIADIDFLTMENEYLTEQTEQQQADIDYCLMLLEE